ncbi:hypothetical protein CK227_25085 [Mesorhizobium sp. WSM4308]|nr:hypothetical protein CK232_24280 [Mesorhizobium sp. WSM4304]PBB72923.1 hypothetical protein CK227_25085 [Mesorhizobium sp. WSM4308]
MQDERRTLRSIVAARRNRDDRRFGYQDRIRVRGDEEYEVGCLASKFGRSTSPRHAGTRSQIFKGR